MLIGLVPSRISYAVMKQAGIPLRGEKLGEISREVIPALIDAMRHYRITVTGTRGMENAQVTAGGAACDEFRPDTLESVIVPGLHAAGEILDVDGACGGFNLMFAFGSGILAGLNGREPGF
jgi:predicted flavoprotein YhiN